MVASQNALDELTSCLTVNTLLDLARRSSETYKLLAKTSTEHFLVTPVTALPTGKEQGKFLAIDVGGSNLRVGFVELVGEPAISKPDSHRIQDVSRTIKRSFDKSWPIGDHLKMDQPEDLFKWIGDCMAEVVQEAIYRDSIPTDEEISLGVTFSFPMARVAMGLIVGTGTNATVPMKPEDLHPEKQNQLQEQASIENVVINTEWTIRGTDKPLEDLGIKTKWDKTLDKNSDAPGFQPFEYMTSGRYLGEIVRLAFVDLITIEGDATGIPALLQQKNAILTRFLSEVVARADEATLLRQLARQYPSNEAQDDGFWNLQRACLLRNLARAVQQRSSALIAAACIGLLDCVGDINLIARASNGAHDEGVEELVIAFTGGTISQYPHWLADCQAWIDKLIAASASAPVKRVVLKEAIDGGIIGAGVLAGMGGKIP
ncbi:hypothetical protein N0V86_004781 [Didymella sp. IMI 355093]|nr:hypothetical protein N0V86_004781 [Didymella sp. IMI 355093]